MFNILFTFRDVRYSGKLVMSLIIWDACLHAYFKGYGIFGTRPLIQASSVYLRVPIKSIAA